jgi:hypothetical protein
LGRGTKRRRSNYCRFFKDNSIEVFIPHNDSRGERQQSASQLPRCDEMESRLHAQDLEGPIDVGIPGDTR